MSTMSLRVVGSPPDSDAFSMSLQRLELNTFSICASVMSSLRLPRVQLLHISQRASHTNVQWKMKTVGGSGVYFAKIGRASGRERVKISGVAGELKKKKEKRER